MSVNTQRTSGGSVTEGLPRYALFDKQGDEICRNVSAAALADLAKKMWPDQEQDDTGSGLGWDIHLVGIRS